MRTRRLVAGLIAVGMLAAGPACAKKNENKEALIKLVLKSAHTSGVFRYSDQSPRSPLSPSKTAQVRGVIEDDFRYKARLTIDSKDVIDEVVNDDALAVRFVDPAYIPNFTAPGGKPDTLKALAARYWITDAKGAPEVGGAAIQDQILGVDPIVDALSITDYVADAIAQSREVQKFNAERLDYRPKEDPFPRPAKDSGVVRWDLVPMPVPRADVEDTGGGDASLAPIAAFRKMSLYVKDGRVVQVREVIGAKYDLQSQLRNYIEKFAAKAGDKNLARVKKQLDLASKDPSLYEASLNIGLNQILLPAGQKPIRFRTMKYEFADQGKPQDVDLPIGTDVLPGDLAFFGSNAALAAARQRENAGNAPSTTTTTTPTSTTVAP
jgi:hypothetical protein